MIGSTVVIATALMAAALQDPPQRPEPEVAQVEDIEVVGRRSAMTIEERVDDFVDTIAAPVGEYGPARWHRRVCIGAINFQPAAAQQIVDRVSQVAMQVGLTPGDPGCKPQVMIVATNNGPEMAAGLVQLDRRLFVRGGSGMDLGRQALASFQSNDRPVRWWHVSTPVDADTGQRAVALPGDDPDPFKRIMIHKFTASRLRSALRDDLRNIVIIIDIAKLGGASFAQVSDYVALLALAQINPNVDVRGHDTILNLFDRSGAVQGLTDWDMAYLHGLYDAELDTVSQVSRLGAVERGMEDRTRNGD